MCHNGKKLYMLFSTKVYSLHFNYIIKSQITYIAYKKTELLLLSYI